MGYNDIRQSFELADRRKRRRATKTKRNNRRKMMEDGGGVVKEGFQCEESI